MELLNTDLNLYALNIVAGLMCAVGIATIGYGILAAFGAREDGIGE